MIDSCAIESNGLISIEQASHKIKQSVTAVNETERIILKNALGRVLSSTITSPINIPSDRNSAMDGYAVASSAINTKQTFSLTLVGTSWAGKPYPDKLNTGECIRIFC